MSENRAYAEYLLSEHWSLLRTAALNAANRKCEACRATKFLVGHHLLYRNPLESCVISDIMCLCDRCHNGWHRWLSKEGKHTSNFTREQTGAMLRTLIGQGFLGKTHRKKAVKAAKRAGILIKQPKPKIPDKHGVLERLLFEQANRILELSQRLAVLESAVLK